MNRMLKFLRLSPSDRHLLIEAAILASAFRLGLWVLPFRSLRSLLVKLKNAPEKLGKKRRPPISKIRWAIKASSRYVPAASCLTQALATKVMLWRHGYSSNLCVGLALNGLGKLEAHAWIEVQGKIVVGQLNDLSRYIRLPPLEGDGT